MHTERVAPVITQLSQNLITFGATCLFQTDAVGGLVWRQFQPFLMIFFLCLTCAVHTALTRYRPRTPDQSQAEVLRCCSGGCCCAAAAAPPVAVQNCCARALAGCYSPTYSSRTAYTRSLMGFVATTYLPVVQVAFDFFTCRALPPVGRVVAVHPSVTCGSPQWNALLLLYVPVMGYALGVPLALVYVLACRSAQAPTRAHGVSSASASASASIDSLARTLFSSHIKPESVTGPCPLSSPCPAPSPTPALPTSARLGVAGIRIGRCTRAFCGVCFCCWWWR
jgi:hypothetical protein